MLLLAHRGLWTDPTTRNSERSLHAALEAGYGIETDFRDLGGTLVVSHDPPTTPTPLTAVELFSAWAKQAHPRQLIAANIKSDGLLPLLARAASEAGLDPHQLFVFDMSVPDMRSYVSSEFPVYTRASDLEPSPALLTETQGVWVDAFTDGYPQVEVAHDFLLNGYAVALVSPELHGRPHDTVWRELSRRGVHRMASFSLCTDYPIQAAEFFGVPE